MTADPLAGFSSATVSDALDRLGRPGSMLGIAPLFDGARLCGPAFTVRYVTAGSPPGTVGDYLDDVPPGARGGARQRRPHRLHGVGRHPHRDGRRARRGRHGDRRRLPGRAAGARHVSYPIYSRGRFMRTGKDRVEVSDVGRPVTVGGVQVRPGDLLLGDADGVVAVPQEITGEVAEICAVISAREEAILADVLAGGSIAEARRSHGYHLLQRKEATT